MESPFMTSRTAPGVRQGEASTICSRCQRLMVLCTCSDGRPLSISRLFPSDDHLPDVLLDKKNIETIPGDDDLDMSGPVCDKSHQHAEFIKVDDFTVDHLPEELRYPTTYVWLRNCIHLVVRLINKSTATGRACLIEQELNKTTWCDDVHCRYIETLGLNHKLHGGIGIITSNHAVEDDDDAAMTRIEFFYNSDDGRECVIHETGAALYLANKHIDYTLFKCFVHFKYMINLVSFFDLRRNQAWLKIPQSVREKSKEYAIIISHPHGALKKISFGKVVEKRVFVKVYQKQENPLIFGSTFELTKQCSYLRQIRIDAYFRMAAAMCDLVYTKYTGIPYTVTWYTTPTCKGSSGAPVYMGNTVMEYGQEINQAHTHRGVDPKKGFNYCLN